MSSLSSSSQWQEDPVYLHGRREAIFILSVWACCFVYTVSYSYLYGYLSHEADPRSTGPSAADVVGPLENWNRDPSTLSYPLGLGIPDWVFYGIAVPWALCIALSLFYAFVLFEEDDLADGAEESDEVQATSNSGSEATS